MPENLDEISVNYEELMETLQAQLEKETSEKMFLVLDGVQIIL